MAHETFTQMFPEHVLICTVFGIYVPHSETILFRNGKHFFYIYTLFAAFAVLIPTVDVAYALMEFEIPTPIKFHLSSCGICYFWALIKIIYMLRRHSKVREIINYWSTSFQTNLFVQYRQEILLKARKKVIKTNVSLFLVFCLPFIGVGLYKGFSRKLFIFSGFNQNFFSFDAPLYLSLLQFTGTSFLSTSWLGFEAMFILLLTLIEVELEYLNHLLYNTINLSNSVYGDDVIKKQMSMWIKHHGQLILFARKVKEMYGPMITGLYTYLILIVCTLLFSALQGRISPENAMYNTISNMSFIVTAYITCSIGDKIESKSKKLVEAALFQNWIDHSRSVHQQLTVISIVCNKVIRIDVHGHTPMNSHTLKEIILMQYRFYTFIRNSMK